MSKKKIEQKDTKTPEVNISGTISAERIETAAITKSSLKGRTVSLNLKAETFFGVGSFWLSPKDYSAVIPETMTRDELMRIQSAINRGILIEGHVKTTPIDRDPDVLEEYWHLIKTYGLEAAKDKSPSMIKFRKVFKDGVDRNWTAKEIARHCISREREYKNRPSVLKLLEDTYRYSMCPETLVKD